MNVLETPPADWQPDPKWSQPKPQPESRAESRPMSKPEALQINKVFGWAVAIISFVFSTASVALVATLWSQGQSLTRIDANQQAMSKQIEALTAAVAVGTQNRYTSTDAATDRASIYQTFNTTREAWSLSFKGLIEANSKLAADVADLRVKVAQLEGRKP